MACPQPVVETKRKLEAMSQGILEVYVDNETAKNNLLKLAASLGLETGVKEEDNIFTVTFLKEGEEKSAQISAKEKNLLLTADTLGQGDPELGKILMKSFFYALAESNHLPQSIYFINSGVKLVCSGSPVLDSLIRLQKRGVQLFACGLCLDYYKLKDHLQVGEVTNMYAIVAKLTEGNLIGI
ncbi:MAG: sulfurtransferase-like selenium metabolism protein YedF [Firmicutes bacterium]|nr:sulfurtransferase-like selenium metabolism protein YedF [Bacillota bacterium]